jgi:hypothetical protein
MRIALYLMTGAATVLAWIVARGRSEHRPVAFALSIALAASLARAALLTWVLPPPEPTSAPWSGWLRVAGVLDSALYLAWPAALAALALLTLGRRSAWLVAAGFSVVVAFMTVVNPRGDDLRQTYLAAELVALFSCAVSLIAWYRRREERANTTTLSAGVMVAGHFATVLTGPYRFGLFGKVWALAQWAYLAIIGIVLLLHVGSLWTSDR